MNLVKLRIALLTLGLAFAFTGCGPSKADLAEKERARLELEERSRRETEAANKAISESTKKLGRKPPSLDLGVPPTEEKKSVDKATLPK